MFLNKVIYCSKVYLGIGQPLAVKELPIYFKIENFDLNGVMLDHETHWMQGKNELFENYRHLTQRSTGDGTIFTCAGFSVGIMWNKTSVFLFDSHSRNNQGFHDPNGKATLLEFRSMLSLNNFLKIFFLENFGASADAQYDLQYISVTVSDESKHQILDSLGRRKKSFYNRTYSESQKKRKYYSENKDFIREKHCFYYNKNAAFIKEKQCSYYVKKKKKKIVL